MQGRGDVRLDVVPMRRDGVLPAWFVPRFQVGGTTRRGSLGSLGRRFHLR